MAVDQKGEFIVVEINNLLLFASGRAEIKAEFEPIAGRIAAALDPEKGPIKIVGHTDNVKPRKSNAFKSNFDLSVARAKAVETVVASKIADRARIVVEGKGEDEPIANNATPEGRTKNRRVDLMIPARHRCDRRGVCMLIWLLRLVSLAALAGFCAAVWYRPDGWFRRHAPA